MSDRFDRDTALEAIGDGPLPALETGGDLGWEHVEEQSLGLGALCRQAFIGLA